MRLIYFGSGTFGLPTLERLARVHDVTCVVTQPDRPAGRRRRSTPTPVAAFAARRGIETIRTQDANAPEIVDRIRATAADAFVVIAFGQKLGPELLADTFAINLHGSLLPKYRGAAPVNWAIINGETETGLTVIAITQRIDAGDILGQVVVPIDPMETAGELAERLSELGPEIMTEVLARHHAGTLRGAAQDERHASAAPRLTKADGTVRFDRPARAVRCRVHGLTPWPGCTVRVGGGPLKLTRVDIEDGDADGTPGEVTADGTIICRPGRLRLLSVQPPGGRQMSFDAYRRGHVLPAGARMEPACG